jgi:hypothetical protein
LIGKIKISNNLKLNIAVQEGIKLKRKEVVVKPQVSKAKTPVVQREPLRKKNKGGEKGRNRGMSM